MICAPAAPGMPRENTLWIETDQAVSGWIMDSREPADPAEGMVWIGMAPEGGVSFQAVKGIALWLRPGVCRQYLSGGWVEKTGSLWQDGSWQPFGGDAA